MTTLTANNYERDNSAAVLGVPDYIEEAEYAYTAQDEERAKGAENELNK